jgi:hypothetical protein
MVTKPNWTVLVYMVADTGHSFYQDAMADITEMMEAEFDERVKVVVHADAPAPWQTKCWEVTGVPHVAGAGSAKTKTGVAKEVPCEDKNLLDFVQKVVDNYASDYYLLVLWGHGEGIDWKQKVLAGRPASSAIKGAGKRFAPGSQGAIEVGELGKALAQLKLGNLKPENVIVGFDACLMGMVEVFDEIKKYVGWVVAADDEIPDTGWPYTDVLQLLGDRPETSPEELAVGIVDKCVQWYSNPDHSPDIGVSFAACNLFYGPNLLTAMKNLTNELIAGITKPPVRKAVKDARDFAEDFREKAYVDLHAFCSELSGRLKGGAECERLTNAADNVINVLEKFVSRCDFSDRYPQRYSKNAKGVSICFPESADLMGSIPDLRINWGSYEDLTFSWSTNWPSFLKAFWDRRQAEIGLFKPKVLTARQG